MAVIYLAAAVLLSALLGILGWAVFVYFSPYKVCGWCEGKRKRRCWRCKGTRRVRRIGAKRVHKTKLSLIQAWNEREFWR
jgi:hypothetical protein